MGEMGEKKKHKHKKKHSRSRSRERYESNYNQYQERSESSTSQVASKVSGGDDISLSIAETNKIRAQLGLAPLNVDGASSNVSGTEEKESLKDDIHVPAINLRNQHESESMRLKLAQIREKRKINQKLGKVKKLADDSDDEDTLTWVKRSRIIQEEKTKAEARAQMLAEMDAEFGVDHLVQEEFMSKPKQYTSKHLKGLKVAHAESRVKDYNPFDDDDFNEDINLKEKGILDKYDEVIDGEKKYEFMLDNYGRYDADFEKSIKKYKS